MPLGTLDLGVDGGRSLVDIPVIGPCEAMFHIAAQLGDRFGIICYHESVIPRQITQTRMYGMEHWIAGRRASGFKLKDIGANKDAMKKNFIAAGRSLIEEDGADVIIVHGITQCPVHMKPDGLTKEWGVPVVEGIGAPIRMAAMLAGPRPQAQPQALAEVERAAEAVVHASMRHCEPRSRTDHAPAKPLRHQPARPHAARWTILRSNTSEGGFRAPRIQSGDAPCRSAGLASASRWPRPPARRTRSWLDQKLLAAAKKEGVARSSTAR